MNQSEFSSLVESATLLGARIGHQAELFAEVVYLQVWQS